MKKIAKIIMLGFMMIFAVPVFAKDNVVIKKIVGVTADENVMLNSTDSINVEFNDLNQSVIYKITLENNTTKKVYVNDIVVENLSEEFIEFSLTDKSVYTLIEPGKENTVELQIKTLDITHAGRNVNDEITLKFIFGDSVKNPETASNWIVYIILVGTFLITMSTMFSKLNKKKKLSMFVVGMLLFGTTVVFANDDNTLSLTGKVKYTSQNLLQESGVKFENFQCNYDNSTDIWKYAELVKNIVISDNKTKPQDYEFKFDLTSTNSRKIYGYLVENNDSKIKYDLYIVANGVIYAPTNSTGLFSFPNVETIKGLQFIEFDNTINMTAMFAGNKKLRSVDISDFQCDGVSDISYMFYDCNKLNVNKSKLKVNNNTKRTLVFNEIYDLVEFNVNGTNLMKYSASDSVAFENDVYYYTGEVIDNNVVFANFCWKMVRTTETGGVKLVYNGVPDKSGSCNNTDDASLIGNGSINHAITSAADVGYMFGDRYVATELKYFNGSISIVKSYYNTVNDGYYAKSFTYENGIYKLDNATKKTWANSYNTLNGYYRCSNASSTSCSTIYYVSDVSRYYLYGISLTGGVSIDDDIIVLGKSIVDNKNGTYSLKDAVSVNTKDWKLKYNNYLNYYICSDKISTTCSNYGKVLRTTNSNIFYDNLLDYKFGNNVTYSDGKYTLKNVYESSYNFSFQHHYTCLNNSGVCNEVYYITNYDNMKSKNKTYYLKLTDGNKIEDVKDDMFSNNTDSVIKTNLEKWYADNLSGYTNQLEDTIWCNDREISYGPLKAGNADSSLITYNHFSSNARNTIDGYSSLSCLKERDSFTVSPDNGNGKLTYPIGLLTADEVTLAGSGLFNGTTAGYLYNGRDWWLMSPGFYDNNTGYAGVYTVMSTGKLGARYPWLNLGVRPSISIRAGTLITSGEGSVTNPYIIN